MAFTYSDTLATPRDEVRFNIKDTQEDEGPRPDGRNFSDNEIAYLLTENSSGIAATVANCFDILESEWTSYNLSEREGEANFDAKGLAEIYGKLAKKWKEKALGTLSYGAKAASVQPDRIDGYSQ